MAPGVAALYRDGEVLARSQTETDYEFVVRLEVWQVNRLREEGCGGGHGGSAAGGR